MFIGAKFELTGKGESIIGYQEIEIVERVVSSTIERKTPKEFDESEEGSVTVVYNYMLHCRCDDTIAKIPEDELENELIYGLYEYVKP